MKVLKSLPGEVIRKGSNEIHMVVSINSDPSAHSDVVYTYAYVQLL